jgi:hypothetical protein
MVQRCGRNTYEQGRAGEERGGKETDGCPLTTAMIEKAAADGILEGMLVRK